jgi:hypothetical protein
VEKRNIKGGTGFEKTQNEIMYGKERIMALLK